MPYKFIRKVRDIFVCTLVGVLVVMAVFTVNQEYFSREASDDHIREIYAHLLAQTGQTQDAPVFIIEESGVINAYTDGAEVVLFRGMIDFAQSDDEIALVLGHELAHVMLKHTDYTYEEVGPIESSVNEANADKLGAFYAMKAGYDVCEGRDIWKRFLDENGNSQGGDHPSPSYRYDELNVNCE